MPSNSRDLPAGKAGTEEQQDTRFHLEVARQMVSLSTAGFGLVAALAWNNLIQAIVNTYIKKWLPLGGQIISMAIYALIVTVLAVIVTLQLSKIVKKLEEKS